MIGTTSDVPQSTISAGLTSVLVAESGQERKEKKGELLHFSSLTADASALLPLLLVRPAHRILACSHGNEPFPDVIGLGWTQFEPWWSARASSRMDWPDVYAPSQLQSLVKPLQAANRPSFAGSATSSLALDAANIA